MKKKHHVVIAATLILGLVLVAGTTWADGMPGSEIDPSIIGVWRWTAAETPTGSISPLPQQDYLMSLFADGTVSMRLEFNIGNGTYTADGTTVAIEPTMATLAAWAPASPAPRLIELLVQAREYRVVDRRLELETLGGQGRLVFEQTD